MPPAVRRLLRRLGIALMAVAAATGCWWIVQGGRYLQHEDPLRKADAIFVLAGTRMERALEGVELYREGWAPVVALSPGRTELAEDLVRARGVPLPADAAIVRDAMIALGVPARAILLDRSSVDNTAAEATLLSALAAKHHWRTVIVVTSKYHTRRTGFAMRRAVHGSGLDIIVRASRYDPSDPARWWRRRYDFRFAIFEWEKLIAYRLGLAD
jgi:uncharacterized SAM-binding protein YcdF (DUF218 family)